MSDDAQVNQPASTSLRQWADFIVVQRVQPDPRVGDQGTILAVYPGAYEVECSDADGSTVKFVEHRLAIETMPANGRHKHLVKLL